MDRKPVGPPGLSRIEDDGRRTPQTIIDATEYERLVAIEKAARDLVTRLDEIAVHPSYQGQVTIAHLHGHRYDGPTWVYELRATKIALGVTP